jgi:hypothetical protein
MRIAIIAACLALAGCATTGGPTGKIELPLPASATVPCPDISGDKLDGTLEDALRWIAKHAPMYDECSAKVQAWIDYEKAARKQ